MQIRLYPIAVALLLGLAACVTEYSKSEAPAALRVDGAQSRVEIAFGAGSDRLSPGEARRLDGLVLAGNIRPADRVAIAAAGPPGLAARRAGMWEAGSCGLAWDADWRLWAAGPSRAGEADGAAALPCLGRSRSRTRGWRSECRGRRSRRGHRSGNRLHPRLGNP